MNETERKELEEALAQAGFAHNGILDENHPAGFSCRGCGLLCCTNKNVALAPFEYARIMWQIERTPEMAPFDQIYWRHAYIGHRSGWPQMCIDFVTIPGTEIEICPFVMLPGESLKPDSQPFGLCGIYEVRPLVCQIFPFGRAFTTGGEVSLFQSDHTCPGFEPAGRGEAYFPDYVFDPDRTVGEYIQANLVPEMDAENTLYKRILMNLSQKGYSAKTDDNPDGKLTHTGAMLLGSLLYSVPDCPDDPGDDHRTIMGWLEMMEKGIPTKPPEFYNQLGEQRAQLFRANISVPAIP
jgi:Fe-S-cluster containining protein